MKTVKKQCLLFLLTGILLLISGGRAYADTGFSDVPVDHWAYTYVNKLKALGVTNGTGDGKFGVGQTISRAEFVAFLCKLLQLQGEGVTPAGFVDVQESSAWYYHFVQAAVAYGIVVQDAPNFRPNDPITREEIAVMLVRSLGYERLANQLKDIPSAFADVTNNLGYIAIARDLEIISGIDAAGINFAPQATAAREQAAAMLVRMYEGINRKLEYVNGFYAISSSSQAEMIDILDSVSFGWSRLQLDKNQSLILNTTANNNNEYRIPTGYELPYARAAGKTRMLMVAVSDAEAAVIINDPQLRASAVQVIASAVNDGIPYNGGTVSFDGVVIDFEALKGSTARNNLNLFLESLRAQLPANEKKIFVAVHPKGMAGQEYYDGYDYRTIGRLADKVILMAHDYNAKKLSAQEMAQGIVMTPLAPIDQVYYALRAITDPESGVEDKSKILFQISFDTAQWKMRDGAVINEKPYSPDYQTLANRIRSGVEMKYSAQYESPYVTFVNSSDGTSNIVWYEDQRSVSAKIKLAKLFGVQGVSIWRLGNVPEGESSIYFNAAECFLKN